MSKILEKLSVCRECLSPDIIYAECVCVTERRYPTIELEFEVCKCCGNMSSQPADTEFNAKQLQDDNSN